MHPMRSRRDAIAVVLCVTVWAALGGCPSDEPGDGDPKPSNVVPAVEDAAPASAASPTPDSDAPPKVVAATTPPPTVAAPDAGPVLAAPDAGPVLAAPDAGPNVATPDAGPAAATPDAGAKVREEDGAAAGSPAGASGGDAMTLAAGFEQYRLDGICVALSGDGSFLAAGDLGGRVTVWDTRRKRLLIQATLPEGNRVRRVAFARGAPVLVSGAFQAPDAPFRVWQTQPAGLRHTIGSLHWQARQLAIDDAGERLAALVEVGGGVTKIGVWGVDDAEPVLVATHEGESGFVSLSGDGRTVAASSQDGTLSVWRGSPLTLVAATVFEQAKTLQRVLLSRDGRLLWGAAGNQVFHYVVDSPPVLERSVSVGGEDAVIRGLELLPDGRAVAVTRPEAGGVQLWDAATGRLLVDANGGCRCEAHALSADGRTLACDCVPDASIRVWRLPAAP
ncbi:MAG: hypothetical protein CVU56_06355 [Deltaproteobacteria bacterium HGW-Deltaproteobacteria-14]|nr:MAG: hypothetical protein CVU56_06355 [Deltaproteobacteria bacterium HGW-Deltaproteobacteria-14]